MLYAPTMAAQDVNSDPTVVYTWYAPSADGSTNNRELIALRSITLASNVNIFTCRNIGASSSVQVGIGYLPGERLMPWTVDQAIAFDLNGGSCGGGTTYPSTTSPLSGGSYGTTGVAPAMVGFNGHAYLAWTGTDGAKHVNIIQAF